MRAFPELAAHEGSWVVTRPDGSVRRETFDRRTAEPCHAAGWQVETIGAYLGRINREIKERAKP